MKAEIHFHDSEPEVVEHDSYVVYRLENGQTFFRFISEDEDVAMADTNSIVFMRISE